jgi:hypothetical protein
MRCKVSIQGFCWRTKMYSYALGERSWREQDGELAGRQQTHSFTRPLTPTSDSPFCDE